MNASIQPIPNQNATLRAILAYESAKADFARAKRAFEHAEADLLNVVGHKTEGAFTVNIADRYKVTTTGKLTRKILADEFERVRGAIPPALLNRLIRTKEELNTRELKFIEANEPEIFRFIAPAIQTKPAKSSVKVELIASPQ